ncbi:serine/threonine-protein kinase [Microcoleus sp. bin38.metabat.b11b12b14.051]|uniref:serine/threonine-protein kinase n=1 Tax=Microcoleus sp. bin38.metabat.b11b12b14.051 TaxID=2742709 RepID=UPI0025D100B8|nr:serine/threonine-protein kinase [Microcoleus sp. bin38.metabat.b11b12b14.051]
MSYCLNPNCSQPQNPDAAKICRNCRAKLLLRDRYRAIKAIGQGGFGRTFLAVDEDKPSKPRCVIKQFLPAETQLIPSASNRNSKKAAELFEQEAMRLDELGKHPQIPELLAYSIQDNRQYVVQEFIDGQNLAQIVTTEGTFTETQIQDLLNSLLPVLHFIHSHNVIHRDIKPGNIIRRADKQLVIVDFGAAKIATGTALLKTGTSIGSPEYIAPEQARGKAFFTSDLYSLGVTCLYLLTQVSPFDLFDPGEDAWIWRQYLANNPVSEQLGKILDKMIENATNRRYQTAVEVLTQLNPEAAIKLSIPQISTKPVKPATKPNSPPQKTHNWQCIHTLTGHKNLISSVAFSPNGEVIASSSDDKTIKLWQVEDGQEIVTIAGHTNSVHTVAFSPDGKTLASSSHDKKIKLWRMKDGQEIRTLSGHINSVYGLAFSPDGETLASSSWDKTIKLWRMKDGQEIRTLSGHINLVYFVAFSPDGETLASSSWDRTIKIWRVKDGKLIRTLTGHTDCVRCVAFSPNGEFLASGSHDNTIKIWWAKDWQEVLTIAGHSWYVDSIAFSPDGEVIASSSNQTIKIWQVKDGGEICNISGHTNSVYSVNFSPEGEFLASGSSDKTIKIWHNII